MRPLLCLLCGQQKAVLGSPSDGAQAWATAYRLSKAAGTRFVEALVLAELGKLSGNKTFALEAKQLQRQIRDGMADVPRMVLSPKAAVDKPCA